MERVKKVVDKYKELQLKMCKGMEELDGKEKFNHDEWESNIGTGITKVLSGGNKIAKGAINFSHVEGKYSEKMARILGEEGNEFAATGISSIFHPVNPWAPIIHMNVRYFALDTGINWFGGGIDLTPHYVNKEQAKHFHTGLKEVCDKYSPDFYPEYKKWADDYFYLHHREETRGVGGIFFDRVKPDEDIPFEDLFNFTQDLCLLYPKTYAHQVNSNHDKEYGDKEKHWQNIRRSRYVEFNLLFDRGTKFGVESGGRTESILVSMPPTAEWHYDYHPEKGTKEKETLDLLVKGIDWLNK